MISPFRTLPTTREKPPIAHAIEIVNITGGLVVIICALGAFIAICQRRGLMQFAVLSTTPFVALTLFWRIQDMGAHHYNIIVIQVGLWTIISTSLLLQFFERTNSRIRRIASNLLIAFMALLSIASCLNMTLIEAQSRTLCALSVVKHNQWQRDDLDDIYDLLDSIPVGSNVYVIASSETFNISVVVNGYLQREGSLPIIAYSAEVDLRDGFNPDFFNTDYVISCSSPQTHLKANSQRIVQDMSNAFSGNLYGIDAHYELTKRAISPMRR